MEAVFLLIQAACFDQNLGDLYSKYLHPMIEQSIPGMDRSWSLDVDPPNSLFSPLHILLGFEYYTPWINNSSSICQ